MYLTNFYFCRTFFLITSYQISPDDAILINHKSFFQEKKSSQLYGFQFLEINSLMTETIKTQFSKRKILINELMNLVIIYIFIIILENWER